MKSIINTIFTAAAVLGLIGCAAAAPDNSVARAPEPQSELQTEQPPEIQPNEATGDLSIYCFKIGKADAFLFQTENGSVLLDCGEDDDGDEIVEYLEDNGINSLDYIIISHFDKDHVGGAAEVLNSVSVGAVITPNYTETSDEYKAFIAALKSNGITQTALSDTYTFTLDDVSFALLPPLSSDYSEEKDNNSSLALSVFHGENSFFFTGDAMDERIAELLSYGDISHTLLKMPHHGIYSDGLKTLVEAVSPQYAIITSSDKNPEDEETLALLENEGVETYITREGDISILSDGKTISIKQ
ncbi:MAG: MBL fold metallo-hydrolase [Clostridiales bacterium]|nr:MBL fold metallo-hydrolase [Clostridiales bacterium]